VERVGRLKLILWMLVGLAAAVATARFIFGLGAVTHLSDAMPWGLWVGFDVMCGVALAAGGFVVTASVYIFKLEKFHSIVRPAVLTAFLGYIAVVVGLLFDLGLPWNIWHLMIYWNPHSPLFEVGWCVMLYLTVLTLEFFPVPAEEFSALARVRRFLIRLRIPLARIIHDFGDKKSLLWYKHVQMTMFEAPKEAFTWVTISQQSVFCSPIFFRSPSSRNLTSGRAVPMAAPSC